MKNIHVSRMERLRSINLRIGFAAAIFLVILAFNWTTERASPLLFEEEAYPTELALKPFTIAQPNQPNQPPATVLKANDLIIEVPDVVVSSLLPTTIPIDSSTVGGPEFGNAKPAAPVVPKAQLLPPAEDSDNAPPFLIVEEMPRFPGCEVRDLTKKERSACAMEQLLKFIYANIRYPELARDAGIEGTVQIKFVVEKDGTISNAQVMRDIGGGCGEEALRVVGKMPKWLPGKQQGRAVRVQFNLPVKFKLS